MRLVCQCISSVVSKLIMDKMESWLVSNREGGRIKAQARPLNRKSRPEFKSKHTEPCGPQGPQGYGRYAACMTCGLHNCSGHYGSINPAFSRYCSSYQSRSDHTATPSYPVSSVSGRTVYVSRSDLVKYRGGSYPRVEELVWQTGALEEDVLKAFPNIHTLQCRGLMLNDIEAIACCKKLRVLNCSHNNIVALGVLDNCRELVDIDCARNQLVSLIGLGNLTKLTTLKCMRNNLTSLEGLENCAKLVSVDCSNNKIGTVGALRGCSQLATLTCDHNRLHDLNGLECCSRLMTIECHNNYLTSIAALTQCHRLVSINCNSNRLNNLTGLENKTDLAKVKASNNRIVALDGLAGCTSLKELGLQSNKIRSTKGLGSSPNLRELDLEDNHLSKLVLALMPKLAKIECQENAIVTLEGLANCPLLQYLDCSNNSIAVLPNFNSCPSLRTLYCSHNYLVSVEFLTGLLNLDKFACQQNCLITLKGIESCRRLSYLNCSFNRITTLEHIIRLRTLLNLDYSDNPLGRISPQVEHFIFMVQERVSGRAIIYNNNENVSDSAVKESAFVSIQNLMRDPAPTFTLSDLKGSGLSQGAIGWLTMICNDIFRSTEYLITYQQLFSYVWQRIQSSEHRAELIKVLEQQIIESGGRCLIGRMTRLLSVLVGFYDDIHIAISTSAQIHAAIKVTERSIRPYNAQTHRTLVAAHLTDLGYADDEAQPWLDAIYDLEEHLTVS